MIHAALILWPTASGLWALQYGIATKKWFFSTLSIGCSVAAIVAAALMA